MNDEQADKLVELLRHRETPKHLTTDEGRKLVETTCRVTKMGHEALLELVMGQFALMTEEERKRLQRDVADHYCWFCGRDRLTTKMICGVCPCRWQDRF
jgi:hypothetical protein